MYGIGIAIPKNLKIIVDSCDENDIVEKFFEVWFNDIPPPVYMTRGLARNQLKMAFIVLGLVNSRCLYLKLRK